MPLPSVLINDANVGDVVGYGRGRGRGGGGVGGGGGGAMAAAVVRGRTLPRTEGRAKNFGANQDTGKSTIRTHESVSRQRTAVTCGRKATLCQEAMKRKEIKHGEGSEGARFSKRGRENDGNAIDASKGSSQSSTAQQQQQQQQRRLKPTTLRMAKNVGESRIPLVSRASFLPKPKVLGQPKVSEIRRSVIISSSVKNATVNNVTPPKEMGSVPVTSTPAIKDNLAYVTFSVSPVENVSVNDLGKTICFGKGTGILRYWGRLEGEEGIWCGVELSRPEGLNDGTYRGFRYFACPPNHGIMWPVSKVHWIEGSGSDCNYCTQLSTELTLNDEKPQEQKSPNSASTDAIANHTFLWDNNVRPEATFEIEKGVTLDGSKDTSGTTFVIANEEIGEKTGEAVTNVTTIITNESRDSENKLALKNRTKQKGSVPKTPSPVSQTKTFKDTRLVSPGKSGICGINTKVVSPIKTNDGKLLNSEAGANSTYTKVKNGASTTMNGSVESPKYGSSAKVNDTYVAAKPKTKEESSTYATSHLNSDKIVDAVYNAKNNERRNNKVADVTDLVGKGLIADFIANISPTPKPSGAMFTLNDTFMYEQPTRRKAILPALVPIDTCMSVSPTKEVPFSQKQDCFVHEKLGLLEDKVSVENKAFDLVNTTFDEKSSAKALPYELPREHASIITEEEMNVSFLSGRESIDWTFLKGSKRNEGLFEGFSSIGERTTSVGGTNASDVDDKCRVSSTVETSDVHRGARNANTVFNITVRESFGMPGVFQNSHVSLIEDVSSSCLIDSTIPEPHSLPGFRGIEDEEESVPPVTLAPSKVNPAPYYLMLNKQNSFEPDESLGILTPDQMADFTVELECSRSASCENLTGSAGSRMALTRASASRPSDLPTSVDGEPTEGSSERTPSPEELPLDPKPVESAEPMRTVPMSFVTSVTSITSLEAGYQGDGENSRPASRSADLPPMAPLPNLPAACRHDPMTDSDFFTESDADAHEEIVRGDRRAQVIDGTLFCAPGGRRCPSFMGEEMESSGIYSDLDKKQDERHPEEAQSEDRTPDTVDTVSQKSQPSPNRLELQAPVIMDCLQVPSCQNPLDGSMESDISPTRLELTAIEMNVENSSPKVLNKSDPMPLKKYKMPKRNVVSKIKAMIESGPKAEAEKEARRSPRTLKKGGRWDAVMSKIEAGKSEQRSRLPRKEVKSRVLENLGPSPPSVSRRPTAGDSGNKSKRRTRGRQDVNSPTRETAHSSVHSSMSDLSSSLRSAKKRLGSPGGSEGSVQSTPRISSPRHQQPPSSLTTTNSGVGSTGTTNNNNNINSSHQHNNNNNNNNNTNSGSNNNHNHHRAPSLSQRSPNTTSPPRRSTNARNNQQARIGNSEVKKSSLDVSKINLERSPSTTRKPAVSRRLPMKLQTSAPTKDRGAKETTNTATRNSVETRDQVDQTEPTYETLQVRQAEVSVQALSVIVQYLAHQLDGFSAPKLKKDCERMKTEWLAARVEAEELKARNLRMEKRLNDEREDHRKTLELRADLETRHAERVAELESALQEASDKFEARLYESLSESAREHQTAIARLRAEHEADVVRREAETDRRSVVHDQGAALRAEVQSLRSVLELRSQEITALRSEIDAFKREIEAKEALEQRTEILETRCEDLMAQLQRKESFERQLSHENNVLLQSFHEESMHKKRLSQKNEELQWRLRQNNEVVTVLANQLATPPQRLSRSLGPEHTNHTHSPDDSPPASPMVKSMVEKSDSVSWTLEIEETPEAMVSRLLRRSGSTCRGISPSDSRPKRPKQPSSAPAAATVSRQSSLRSTPQRAVVLRTRSKSVSVADSGPKEAWTPGFNCTPVAPLRRRPRSDPAASPVVAVESNPGPRPQEAGGEAMISEETSASSSEDESSASSDLPRLAMEFSWSESEG